MAGIKIVSTGVVAGKQTYDYTYVAEDGTETPIDEAHVMTADVGIFGEVTEPTVYMIVKLHRVVVDGI